MYIVCIIIVFISCSSCTFHNIMEIREVCACTCGCVQGCHRDEESRRCRVTSQRCRVTSQRCRLMSQRCRVTSQICSDIHYFPLNLSTLGSQLFTVYSIHSLTNLFLSTDITEPQVLMHYYCTEFCR